MAQLERDAALVRVSRLRRWTIGGAAALTAGFAAFVSATAPGHSLGAGRTAGGESTARGTATPSRNAPTPSQSAQLPPLASPSQLGLQGPSSNPQPATAPTQQAPPAPAAPAPAPVPAPAPSGATSGGS